VARFNVGEAFLQVVASVAGIHEKIAAEVAKIQDVQIDVTPNMAGFREKVAAGLAGIQDVEIDVTPNLQGFREKVAAETSNFRDVTVNVEADVDTAAAEAELAALGSRSPTVHVNVDVDSARANIQTLDTALTGLVSRFQNANLGSTMFAGIGAAIPPLLTSIGQLSGALGLIPAAAAGVGTALAAVVVGSQGLGEAFKAQAAAEQAATAAAQSDAPARQAVAAANQAATAAGQQNVAALQQQVTAGAAHIASLKAQQAAGANVTTELKAAQATQLQNVAALKQAQAATTGNVGALGNYKTAQQQAKQAVAESEAAHKKAKEAADAYAASLQNLAPSAREFVSAVVQLKPAFEQLRLDVQQQLFKGIGDQLLQLGNSALPTISQGLTSMASAINIVVSRVLEFINQQSSIQSWQNIFQNLSTAAGNLASAVKPILQIITDVTEVGSQLLPGLARGFADAAQRAADFVSKAKDTGQLRQWIQTGLDAVKELWGAFKDVVAIIADLAASPGFGPNFLEALHAVTTAVRWFIENVPGATTLVKLFFDAWLFAKVVQGLTNMATTIGTVVTALGGAITKVAEWATANEAASARSVAAFKAVGAAIGLAALAVGADAILPQAPKGSANPLDKAREELHQMAEAIKDPQAALEDLFDEFSHFGDQFDFANSPVKSFIDSVSGGFGSLVQTIAAQLGAVPARIQGAFSGLSGFFSGLWQGIQSAAVASWQAITGTVAGAASGIQSAWGAVSGFFSGLWSGIVSTAQGAWQGLVGFLSGIPAQIQGLWGALSGFFSGLWQGIVAAAQGAWQGLVGFLQGIPGQIQGAWGSLTGFFSGLWQGIVGNAQGIWQSLVGIVQGVAQQIVGAFQAIPGQMAQIGQAIVQGIGQAIQAGWSWLTQLVAQLAQQLFQAAKSALGIASPSKKFAWVGQNIGLGLAQGINASRADAERALAALNAAMTTQAAAPVQRPRYSGTTETATMRSGSGGHGSRDERAWAELERMLRRWRGHDRPAAPLPQQLKQTLGAPNVSRFGVGSTVGLSGSALPVTPAMLSTFYNPNPAIPSPPSTGGGHGGRGGRGDQEVRVTGDGPLFEAFMRMVRSEVRKRGGKAVLGV
jgi:phage-related protein